MNYKGPKNQKQQITASSILVAEKSMEISVEHTDEE
jgi:hypothetical protein